MSHLHVFLLIATAGGALFTTSCAASRGFGQDLQKLGGNIERKADESGGAQPNPSYSSPSYTPPPPSAPSAY